MIYKAQIYFGTCLRDMSKKPMFSHFIVVFLSYYALFWSSRAIYKPHHTRYMLERHDQKLIIFVFSRSFHDLLPTVCGSGAIYKPHGSWYMFERHDQKLIIFAFYWHFHQLLPIVLGFRCDFTRPMTLYTCLRGWQKTHCFQYFMVVFVSYCA
jgi:hypothetical protein